MIQQFHSWVYAPKGWKVRTRKDICTLKCTAVLFTMAKWWKQQRKRNVVHTHRRVSSSLKQGGDSDTCCNKTLTHVTISLEEDILLCENILLRPDKYYVIPLR